MRWLKGLGKNWTLKLFSVGVAIVLFLFVSAENSTPIDVDFRLEYRLGDDMMVVNDAPLVIHTTLRGPWAAFRSFDSLDLEPIVLDLQSAGPGTVRHFVDLAGVHPPGGMRVVSVRPGELEIVLDRRVVREVPVHADISQVPAFGYEMMDVRLVPSRVRVVGPASKMQGLEFLSTRAIDVHEREDDLNVEVDVRPPPPPLRLLDRRVTAFVEISEEMVQRTFSHVPVTALGAPPEAQITPPIVALSLKGPRKIIEKMADDALSAAVDVSHENAQSAANTTKSVVLRQLLPERTQLSGPMPKVRIEWPGRKAKRKGPP